MKPVLALAALLGSAVASRPAFCAGDIVFAARFYNSPQQSKGRATSRTHLFRIDASGQRQRQITRGAHDDESPRWSPDGQSISFVRDGDSICVAKADGSEIKKLAGLFNLPVWSPDSREIGLVDDGSHTLFFINVQSGQRRSLANVNKFAWSPDGKQLAWTTPDKKLCVADLGTKSRTYTAMDISTMAWAAPQVLVAATGKMLDNADSGLDTLVTLDTAPSRTEARVMQKFPIHAVLPIYGDSKLEDLKAADWRSELMPIPGAPVGFAFRWDNSTSSGRDGFYMRASTQNGVLKLLAHGQSFAFEPGGKRFAWAPYHELTPYNVPGQRPKLVYTSPLKVNRGDGSGARTLVSGLALIYGCDWR